MKNRESLREISGFAVTKCGLESWLSWNAMGKKCGNENPLFDGGDHILTLLTCPLFCNSSKRVHRVPKELIQSSPEKEWGTKSNQSILIIIRKQITPTARCCQWLKVIFTPALLDWKICEPIGEAGNCWHQAPALLYLQIQIFHLCPQDDNKPKSFQASRSESGVILRFFWSCYLRAMELVGKWLLCLVWAEICASSF